MLEHLEQLPPDPILGLSAQFKEDPNPNKVNLGVGVYKDDSGNTPIFAAIKEAESRMLTKQDTKGYIGQAGDPVYLEQVGRLVLGEDLYTELGEGSSPRVQSVMTPGGSGALRMLAGLIDAGAKSSGNSDLTVWVPTPTWGNHTPLLSSAGLKLESYPYYNLEAGLVEFEAMKAGLEAAKPGDVLLLHACCHNPSGADLSPAQWDEIIDFAAEKELLAFIDMAYQGLGTGLDEDAYGVRRAAEKLPEVLVAVSSSKTFGVYRERAGMAMVIGSSESAPIAQSHIMNIARRTYSMSAFHGAGVIGEMLADADLNAQWRGEIDTARNRINELRVQLAEQLNAAQDSRDFAYIAENRGMFSILGLSKEQAIQLREEFGIYILNSSRINVAGLTESNLGSVVEAVAKVM